LAARPGIRQRIGAHRMQCLPRSAPHVTAVVRDHGRRGSDVFVRCTPTPPSVRDRDMSLDADLMALLLDAADGLPDVQKKRMFGFEALWASGRIFALVWHGRIALRLPDPAAAAGLSAVRGAAPLTIVEGRTGGNRWI